MRSEKDKILADFGTKLKRIKISYHWICWLCDRT